MTDLDTPQSRYGLPIFVALANAFLFVSALSAATGLLDSLVLKSSMDSAFFLFRIQLGGLAAVLTMLTLAQIVLVPQLPKLTLLPPLLAALWQLAGAPGLSWSLSDPASMARLDGIMLGATAVGMLMNKLNLGTWFIRTIDLPVHERLFTRTLIAGPIAALLLVVVGVVALVAAIPTYIEQESRGYLHFAANGLEVRETVMKKGDSEVRLVGMVHIGEPEFYRQLYAGIPPQALILAEGVTDRENRMKAKPSYDNAARGLGLQSQGEFQSLLAGSNIVEAAPAAPPAPGAAPAAVTPALPVVAGKPSVVFADVDVSELSPETLAFIEAAGSIFQSATLSEAAGKYMEITGRFTELQIRAVMEELVKKRNEHALAALDRHVSRFNLIYLPWGALHMPDFEDRLVARGYRVVSSRMIPIAKYETIMNGLLGQNAAPAASAPAAPAQQPQTAPVQ
jgi:hypothetical protein